MCSKCWKFCRNLSFLLENCRLNFFGRSCGRHIYMKWERIRLDKLIQMSCASVSLFSLTFIRAPAFSGDFDMLSPSNNPLSACLFILYHIDTSRAAQGNISDSTQIQIHTYALQIWRNRGKSRSGITSQRQCQEILELCLACRQKKASLAGKRAWNCYIHHSASSDTGVEACWSINIGFSRRLTVFTSKSILGLLCVVCTLWLCCVCCRVGGGDRLRHGHGHKHKLQHSTHSLSLYRSSKISQSFTVIYLIYPCQRCGPLSSGTITEWLSRDMSNVFQSIKSLCMKNTVILKMI